MYEDSRRLHHAAAWNVLSRLAARLPDAELVNWLFEGGHYDVLDLRTAHTQIAINWPGSLHYLKTNNGPQEQLLPSEWIPLALRETDGQDLVATVAETARLSLSPQPRQDPAAIQWRTIARLLAAKLFDSEQWLCLGDQDRSNPADGMTWLLRRGDEVLGELHAGTLRSRNGTVVRLHDEYAKGASIDQLVAIVTRATNK